MEKLEIRKYPDSILRDKCEPIKIVTTEEVKLFENMISTMHYLSGIGLAAPQVGISRQLIIADIGDGIIKLANPKIIKIKDFDEMVEGCLSISDVNAKIKRGYEIEVSGLNEKGEIIEFKAKGLLARVIQHEIDHLNGKLIIDYMSFWRRLKFKRSLENS